MLLEGCGVQHTHLYIYVAVRRSWDVQLALGVLYSDVSAAAKEIRELQEWADMELLDRDFKTRAIRLNITRAASGLYHIRHDAVQLVKRILWGRILALARRIIQALPDGTKLISRACVGAALAEPMPAGWNVKLF